MGRLFFWKGGVGEGGSGGKGEWGSGRKGEKEKGDWEMGEDFSIFECLAELKKKCNENHQISQGADCISISI